jgi:phytoene synthase
MLSSFFLTSDNLIKSKIVETLLSIFDLIKLSLVRKNDDSIEHDHDLINEEINLNERI